MRTTAKVAKYAVPAYKTILRANAQAKLKLQALLETNTLYKLFEHDEKHPYYALVTATDRTRVEFEDLLGGLMQWSMDKRTVRSELEALMAQQDLDETHWDEDLDALSRLASKPLTEREAATKLLTLYVTAQKASSAAEKRSINYDLRQQHGNKLLSNHREKPEVEILPQCRTAAREVGKFARQARHLSAGDRTILVALEQMQVTRGLKGQGADYALAWLIKTQPSKRT